MDPSVHSSSDGGAGAIRPRAAAPAPAGGVLRWTGRAAFAAAWIIILSMAAVVWLPRVANVRTDVIIGRSMEPTIPLWSVIVVGPVDPEAIRSGDVITFQRPDDPSMKVTHRVRKVVRDEHGLGFVTRGDNNTANDPYVVRYDSRAWRVRGHVPALGWAIHQAQRPVARIVLIVVPILLLLVQFLAWLWRPPAAGGDADDGLGEAWDDEDLGDAGLDVEDWAIQESA